MKSGFVPFVSEVVDAIADTSTLAAKITAKKKQIDSYGFEATKHFPLVAQSVLLTLDQFFLEGEFTEAVRCHFRTPVPHPLHSVEVQKFTWNHIRVSVFAQKRRFPRVLETVQGGMS